MNLITGEIETLAFGGEGILRHNGLVIFVPFTAPGDRITCRLLSQKKNFARGELVEIHKKGLARINPRCPYYGKCGGCQLQHLSYEAQLQHKTECVTDTLKRIGNIPLTEVSIQSTELQWAYRRRVTLTLKPHGQHYIAGYTGCDNRSLIPVDCCPIFAPESDPVLANVQALASQLKSHPKNEGKASIIKKDAGGYLLQLHFKQMPENTTEVCQKELDAGHWKGIVVSSMAKTLSFGDTETFLQIDQIRFQFSPKAFIQSHPDQSLQIYRRICFIASQAEATRILDLYCGVGISSILLAKQASVIGVEGNAEAVKLANKNAIYNKAKAVFIHGDVEAVLSDLLHKHKPDLAIVNPPRVGLAHSVVQQLLAEGAKHLIYVSCNPATLARDLRDLSTLYHLNSCEAFDMFPQTAHVETLVHLIRHEH